MTGLVLAIHVVDFFIQCEDVDARHTATAVRLSEFGCNGVRDDN